MDFEVKHLICAGLDVHKKTIVAAVCMTDPVTLEAAYKVKSFSTNNSQIAAMRDWLLSYNCHDVCMESTGKYWIPVFNILETHMHVVLTHPKYVKAIKGKKTDKRDAKWIANLFRFDIVAWIFGGQDAAAARVVYTLVALASIWCISLLFRPREETDTVAEHTTR